MREGVLCRWRVCTGRERCLEAWLYMYVHVWWCTGVVLWVFYALKIGLTLRTYKAPNENHASKCLLVLESGKTCHRPLLCSPFIIHTTTHTSSTHTHTPLNIAL